MDYHGRIKLLTWLRWILAIPAGVLASLVTCVGIGLAAAILVATLGFLGVHIPQAAVDWFLSLCDAVVATRNQVFVSAIVGKDRPRRVAFASAWFDLVFFLPPVVLAGPLGIAMPTYAAAGMVVAVAVAFFSASAVPGDWESKEPRTVTDEILDAKDILLELDDYTGSFARVSIDYDRWMLLEITLDRHREVHLGNFKTVLEALSRACGLGFDPDNLTADEEANKVFWGSLEATGMDLAGQRLDRSCRAALEYERMLDALLSD